jgi:nucleoid-associated protein YgaU
MAEDPKKPDFSDVVSGGSGKPDFSDVVSGSSSTAPSPVAGGGRPDSGNTRTYVVQSGDSLSKIAKKFYGDANAWKRIAQANTDLIKNPDLIQPGWNLKIPD